MSHEHEGKNCMSFFFFLLCVLFLCLFDKEKVIPKESYVRLMFDVDMDVDMVSAL